MSIAANLRRAMDEKGISTATLAAQIDADASSIRKYLSGKVRPADAVLARLAGVLGITPEELKYGKQEGRIGQLTTDEVARITGIDPLSLRIGCQRGLWPFGTAYKRPGSSRYTYIYYPAEVMKFTADLKAVAGGRVHEITESLPGSFSGAVN